MPSSKNLTVRVELTDRATAQLEALTMGLRRMTFRLHIMIDAPLWAVPFLIGPR